LKRNYEPEDFKKLEKKELKNEQFSYFKRELKGPLPQLLSLKIVLFLLLLLLSFLQYIISPLKTNFFFGGESLLIMFFQASPELESSIPLLPSTFFIFAGILIGAFFSVISVLPKRFKKMVKIILCFLIFAYYFLRIAPKLSELVSVGAGPFSPFLILLAYLGIMAYLIGGELGLLFLMAGAPMSGAYGLLSHRAGAIKLSSFLFVLYVFDAVGSLSDHFFSFVFFSFFLFVFLQLGLQICEIYQFHKENTNGVKSVEGKLVSVQIEDKGLMPLKNSFNYYITFTAFNLSFIFIFSLIIYYFSEIIAFILPSYLKESIEMSSITGKLVSIFFVLLFFLFLKLFFGEPSHKVDKSVFKKRRLERLLREKTQERRGQHKEKRG